MKKPLFLLLLASFLTLSLSAQTTPTGVKGVVTDSISAQGEPYVTIRLLREGAKTPSAVAATDENGRFTLTTKIPAGTYILEASSIGKQPLRRTVSIATGQMTDVGTLHLQDAGQLGAVTVTAQRQLVKAEVDRISYSLKDDPEAQSSTVLDMLRKVPMVTVDGSDAIKVNGSSDFKIYVNGKPNQMMTNNPSLILKSYPSASIKSIEVITDPGAKYDAEGTSGILNIITDSETKTTGYNISPTFAVHNRGYRGSLFAIAQFGKFTFSVNYGIGYDKQRAEDKFSEQETFSAPVNHFLRRTGVAKGHGIFQYGSLDASYEFSTHDLLSVSAGIHGYSGKHRLTETTSMTDINDAAVYGYEGDGKQDPSMHFYNGSVDFQHTFSKPEQTLTLSYRVEAAPSSHKNREIYTTPTGSAPSLIDRDHTTENHSTEHTFQADFTTPIGKDHKLSTGAKYIYRNNESENTEFSRISGSATDFALDDDASMHYIHRADIAAGYGEYTFKHNDFSLRAGVRYEWSRFDVSYPGRTDRDAFTSRFNDVVPSLNLSYNLKPTMMLKAGYGMRISRPTIDQLSPYVENEAAEEVAYGNPNLESAKAHNLTLGFGSFGQKLSVNAQLIYSVINDGVTDYYFLNDANQRVTTYGQMLHSKLTTLSLYLNWMLTKTTVLTLNTDMSYSDYKAYHYYGDANAHNSGFAASFFGNLKQELPWKLRLALFGAVSSRSVSLQSTDGGFKFYGLSLSRSFLKEDRLTIEASARNFITPKWKFKQNIETETFRSMSWQRINFFNIGISVRYRFGSLNTSVKKTNRTIENDDVDLSAGATQGSTSGAGGGH